MKAISYLIILIGFMILWILRDAEPLIKLGASSLLLIFLVKVAALIWQWSEGVKPKSKIGLALYVFAWPGVSFNGFETQSTEPPPETGQYFLESWMFQFAGFSLLLLSAYFGKGESLYFNYLALIALMFIVHLGLVEILADGFRLMGFKPQSLFVRPLLAKSLRDFWSHRWNLAFVDMNKIFILKPLAGKLPSVVLIFLIFLISGVLHELGNSYPTGGPWGFPFLYFVFQAIGVLLERKMRFPRALVIAWILLPLPLLFPPAFVNFFLGGLCNIIYVSIFSLTSDQVLRFGFIAGAVMHVLVLGASMQVPGRLHWSEELKRLRPLNRKVFWTYGAYILTIIIFMAGVSVHLSSVVVPVRSDLFWAIFIAVFWCARVGIDFFYMKKTDWPVGPLFRIGHIALSTLFLAMTALYVGLGAVLGERLVNG